MARWKVKPATANNTMAGGIDYDDNESFWKIYQDESPFIEQAKRDRELAASGKNKKDLGYKKFATIPDIVAIEVKEKWGIDIHHPDTMKDKDLMAKFMTIIKTNYSYLMSY